VNRHSNFWVCFWLYMILMFGTDGEDTRKGLDRIGNTLDRIEAKLDALQAAK
jgi:hypothetical protein